MPAKRRIAILGASGSIGLNAIRVIEAHPDRLELVGIAGGSRWEPLAEIAQRHSVREVALFHPCEETSSSLKTHFPEKTTISTGEEGLRRIATMPEVDMVLIAVVGTAALDACIAAIEHQKWIALASKEILVMAGAFIMPLLTKNGAVLIPTDSEHNAIFQCLNGLGKPADLEKIIITASGGRYLRTPLESFDSITPDQAVQHPNWDMGKKISIDSSTMANKGLEVIEAKWLFDLEPEQIEVVVHPQSLIHSMVQFTDGSVLSQMSPPNMSFAIQHCLLYPDRAPGVDSSIDFRQPFEMSFEAPDFKRFPCLLLAFEALKKGATAPAIYNAANEVAVEAFIENRISFLDIPRIIEFTLGSQSIVPPRSVQDIIQADGEAREISYQHTIK